MADNNGLETSALNAQKEFSVILDTLRVPLKAGVSDQNLPFRRRWRGGCLLKRPDLVPVTQPEAEKFCSRDDDQLLIAVKNQGNANAPESVTRVIFMPGRPDSRAIDKNTLEVSPGQVVNVEPVDIPQDCFASGECEFTITVDANNQVLEFDKANNTVSGKCSRGGVDIG